MNRVWGDVVVIVRRWDGTIYRWAGDELDEANIPCDLVYTTTMPGGFSTCTCTLFRQILEPAPEGLFDDVFVVGPGGQTYWEGRLQAMPSSTDDGGRINPSAVGWSSHLEDRRDVPVSYVDRDLSQWGQPTAGRARAIIDGTYNLIDGSQVWDADGSPSAGPVLRLVRDKGTPAWTSTAARPAVTMTYSSAVPVARVEWRCRQPRNIGDANWTLQARSWVDAAQTVLAAQVNTVGTALTEASRITVTAPSPSRALEMSLRYALAPGGSTEAEYGLCLAEVAVYGDLSGVEAIRTDSLLYGAGQGPYGVTASSVVRDLVRRFASLIVVDDESVQRTAYPIPHLVERSLGTVASAIELVNRSHWWDWAVWERRRLWFHERFGGQSRVWLVAIDDGAKLTMEGDTTDVIWNGVVVSYTDFGGESRTVGPPGSAAGATDPRLASGDADNPATLHGIPKTGHFELSMPDDYEGAVLAGAAWLKAQSAATRRGSCTVVGSVLDENGNEHPVDMVRAGDQLWIVDRPDDPPRRIIETSMARAGRTNVLTLDNTAQTLEALLERMDASLVGVL